jgi:thiopeptide-type bacteriocin biosynthesis protein
MKTPRLKFPPGSEWLYIKIYGGPQALEDWLINSFMRRLSVWRNSGLVKQFHFIHYIDPDYHLRMRLLLSDEIHTGTILQAIQLSCRELLDEDLIWKIEIGTYEPEYERYGVERMPIIERWFEIDSLFWLREIEQMLVDDHDIWKRVVLSIDFLLDDFETALDNKIQIISKLKDASGSYFSLTRSMKGQLDEKYRKLSDEVDKLLINDEEIRDESLSMRSVEAKIIINQIQESFESLELLFASNLLPDLIHMSLNRAFRTKHRLQELVVYDFLGRYYESRKARG